MVNNRFSNQIITEKQENDDLHNGQFWLVRNSGDHGKVCLQTEIMQ